LEKAWRDQAGVAPLSPGMAFGPEGLTLGAGTVLASVDGLTEADERDEARLYALLSAAYRQPIGPQAIRYIRRGAASWRAGDEAMAAMHLAMTGLMPLRNVKDAARRLFMADMLMKAGTGPDVILRALDILGADGEDALTRYSPDQPRNPAGSGRVSGQWTREGASAASQRGSAAPPDGVQSAGSAAAAKPNPPGQQVREPSVVKPSQNVSSEQLPGGAASLATSDNPVATGANAARSRTAPTGEAANSAGSNLPSPETNASLFQPVSARVLTSEQQDIAASLRGVIANTGQITPNTYQVMRNAGLKTGDVLNSGIYQVEFDPHLIGIPVPNAAHSQYVYIDASGNSSIISGAPKYNKLLSVLTGSFDGAGQHSLGTIVGKRSQTIAIYNVGLPKGEAAADAWNTLNYLARQIKSAHLNYHATQENSNSLFYTLAKYAKISVNTTNNTPGRELDLFAVIHGSVPMKPVFTGVENAGNSS
jgi:hypothetical protein